MNKIVHLIFSLEVGGAENLLVDIANEQARKHSVFIVIVNSKYDKGVIERISKNIPVYYAGRTEGKRSLMPFVKIWKWLYKNKPDVIHCHNHKLIQLLLFWRRKAVITVHGVRNPVYNLKKYSKVFSISEAVQHDLLERGNLVSFVVYNGIAIDAIRQRQFHCYDKEQAYRMVQVGRLNHPIKGQHIALKALKKLHALGYTNVQLYLIGDGPSKHYLQQLAQELSIESSVFFLGEMQRSWIYNHLFTFDLLVQPSLYEGFGLTVVEGLAAGLPVLASNVDGPAEILKNIPGGFLFESGNTDSFVQSVTTILSLTAHHKIQELCAASRSKIYPKYSITHTAEEYVRQYSV